MTVAVPGPGGVIEHQTDMDDLYDDMVGLEDLDESDVRVPRLKIIHSEMVFQDQLSGVKYPQLNTIILGVTKQRLMFDPEVDENEKKKPWCKSPDHDHGFPNVDPSVSVGDQFPWARSSFQDPAWRQPSTDPEMNGHVVLPCVSCNFKEWSQDGNGKRKPPPCAEQFSYALLYGEPGEEPTIPAILTVQRSGMAPAKQYNAFFVTQRKLFFSVYTTWTLAQQKRGTVTYCTPVMQRGDQTDPVRWNDWADQARSIRTFLRSVPRAGDDGTSQVDGPAQSNVNAPPPQAAPPQAPPPAPAAAAAQPVQAAAPAPVAPPAPAPVPPPAPAPVADAAPAQAPVTAPATPAPQVAPPTPPAAPPTPPAAPPAQAPAPAQAPPPQAPAPAAAPATPADSASDLPF